jgi:DNA-directed RNA polymerase specialized sigma24 family protein
MNPPNSIAVIHHQTVASSGESGPNDIQDREASKTPGNAGGIYQSLASHHPWAHLNDSFKVLIGGHNKPEEQRTKEYFDAWTQVNTALCATAAKILGGRNVRNPGFAAEEVTQGWFITMHNGGFESCDPTLPFFPFGYVIFVAQCLNYGRAQRRQPASLMESWVADSYLPTCPMEAGEVDNMVHGALGRLSVDLRNAVMSQHFEGLSAAEAAAKYGTTPANMDLRRCRGRKALATLLTELDPRC